MQKILRIKGTGKTDALIKMAHERGGYIVCMNEQEAHRVVSRSSQLGYDILFPMTFNELLKKEYYGAGIKEIYIDNADLLLQRMFPSLKIEAITMTDE